MSKRKELALYATVVLAVILLYAACRLVYRPRACCQNVLAGTTVWHDGPVFDANGCFDNLVWASTETGVQLRSASDIAIGDKWAPLIAPIDAKCRITVPATVFAQWGINKKGGER